MFSRTLFACLLAAPFLVPASSAAELKVGRSSCDITPDRPILLDGQMHTRVSKRAATPITANIVALEGELNGTPSRAIVVSVDMASIRKPTAPAIRDAVKKLLPDFDVDDIVVSATHTHTSGVALDDKYHVPEGTDYMKPSEFVPFVAEKIAVAAKEAWDGRQPVKFSYGLGFAVVAYCRRAVYADGSAVMYGKTNKPDFRKMESMEDHDIGTMFFWDKDDKLLAMIVNVTCPAQEVEGLSEIHADFWDPTRKRIWEKYGKDVTVVAWIGAAGEHSPHTQYRAAAEDRMRKLRKISRIEEIARRIANAVDESYEVAQLDKKTDVPFRHEFAMLSLPYHKISEKEYESMKSQSEAMKKRLDKEPGIKRTYEWTRGAVDQYDNIQNGTKTHLDVPIHVLRIGDTAVMTNPFELFCAYGIRMKARCKATQVFVVELTDSPPFPGGYLPTEEAYRGGGYSAIPQSVRIGPEGGQMLVEESLKRANELFK